MTPWGLTVQMIHQAKRPGDQLAMKLCFELSKVFACHMAYILHGKSQLAVWELAMHGNDVGRVV